MESIEYLVYLGQHLTRARTSLHLFAVFIEAKSNLIRLVEVNLVLFCQTVVVLFLVTPAVKSNYGVGFGIYRFCTARERHCESH